MMRITLLLLITLNVFAIEPFYHSSCKVWHDEKLITDLKEFYPELKQALSDKGFLLEIIRSPKSITPAALYLIFEKSWTGDKVYQDCELSITIKQAKEEFRSHTDKTIFHDVKRRGFPRVSLKDPMRCTLALRDLLFLLPKCKSGEN